MAENKKTAGETAIQTFTFNPSNQPIRVEAINGEPWFVAKDVCDALTITNNRDAVAQLDDDEKLMSVITTSGQGRQMWLVNESGLYNLIFQSRKPEAKAFRRWVTSEVLPSIRKTGRYQAKPKKENRTEGVIDKRRRSRRSLVDEETLNLLWLIGENLNRGDQKDIAIKLGVTVQCVNTTLNGYHRNAKVLAALYERALENREKDALYSYPTLMAQKLLDGSHLQRKSLRALPANALGSNKGKEGGAK